MDFVKKIMQARRVLANPGPLLPGSISEQYSVCGNPACQCADPHEPKRHGPYPKLSYSLGGRKSTVFLHAGDVVAAQAMIENYKAAREALNELSLAGVDLLRSGGGNALSDAYAASSPQPEARLSKPSDSRMASRCAKWKAKAMERQSSLEKCRIKERDLCASRDKWRGEALADRKLLAETQKFLAQTKSALAKKEFELAKASEHIAALKKKRKKTSRANQSGTGT
jgi:hypothetical protein